MNFIFGTVRAGFFVGSLAIISAAVPAGTQAQAADTKAQAPKENAMSFMWDLTDLYPTEAAWSAAYEKAKAEVSGLDSYKGTLAKGAASLRATLEAMSHARKEAERLYTYASLRADENIAEGKGQERKQQALALMTLFGEKTAFLSPEILRLNPEAVRVWIESDAVLKSRFDFYLEDVLRSKPHVLGEEAEGVLASAGTILQQPNTIYDVVANAELPFPEITLSDGTKAKLNQSNYSKYRQVANRADRKLVFDRFWGAWKEFEGTNGATLTAQVMSNIFSAKTRKYDNVLSAALFSDNMPQSVYRTLVAQANAGLPTLHRYFGLRKRLLGIKDDMRYYDIYPSMFAVKTEPHFSVAESEKLAIEALAPYGADYIAMLKKGFAGKWVDAAPREGKANGAYMNGSAYDVHPYLLLNHNDDYDSLSTLAHEWGHAVHTLLTKKNQPYEKADYSTFTAESASIANEMLLNDYMVAHAKSKEERLYYLGEGLEAIRGTFFRQVMFAEFELSIHEEVEAGRPLSGERLTDMYCALLKKYHGDDKGVVKIDPAYCVEWAFIPHFYYNFYVYQYATSMAGAAQFTDAIIKEGQPAAKRFLALLEAGGSAYPYDLYKQAGIDMASPAPYQALIARMNRIMDEIETLEKN